MTESADARHERAGAVAVCATCRGTRMVCAACWVASCGCPTGPFDKPDTQPCPDCTDTARFDTCRADNTGWAHAHGPLGPSVKAHYFLGGRSLCGSFSGPPIALGHPPPTEGFHDSPEHCTVCRDKREDLAARGEVPR